MFGRSWVKNDDLAKLRQERDAARKWANDVERLHAGRHRLGSFVVNPIEMPRAIRQRTGKRVQVEFDGRRLVVYSEDVLSTAELNAIKADVAWDWDGT